MIIIIMPKGILYI